MNPLIKFNKLVLDTNLLNKSSQNHERRKYVNDHIMTKELLSYLIKNCNYSAYHVATEIFHKKGYDVDAGTIIDKCKLFKLPTKSIEETANDPTVRMRYENTCLKKYGEVNALSKGTKSFKKRNRTVKKKYGVKNVFQLETIKKKSKMTLFEKYGVSHPIELPTYERNNGRKSKLQKYVERLIKEIGVEFKSEVSKKFGTFNQKLNKFYSPIVDILIESKKIVIEVNGDLWHGNPKFYKANDVIKKWKGDLKAKEIWRLDKIRNTQIQKFGYKVIVLWEYDIRNREDFIVKKLKKLLL